MIYDTFHFYIMQINFISQQLSGDPDFYLIKINLHYYSSEFKHQSYTIWIDNQSLTVKIIKIKNHDEILGGYNPLNENLMELKIVLYLLSGMIIIFWVV